MMPRIVVRAGLAALLLVLIGTTHRVAQAQGQKKQKPNAPFNWVNPPLKAYAGLPIQHKTFRSQSMGIDVGYCIYLPPGYDQSELMETRYPVVYYLHGGRPGRQFAGRTKPRRKGVVDELEFFPQTSQIVQILVRKKNSFELLATIHAGAFLYAVACSCARRLGKGV